MSPSRPRSARRAWPAIATWIVLVSVAATAVIGCGSKDSGVGRTDAGAATASTGPSASNGPSTTPETRPAVVVGAPGQVVIRDYDFVPNEIDVKAGTTVTWTNTDVADHWVVSAPASPEAFDLGRQRTGVPVTRTFAAPGTYPYYCNLHNYMKGTVVVS